MEWLNNLTNGEYGPAINLVFITLAMAFLLIVIVWIFRKITGSAAKRAMRSRVPRLSITDSTTVDEKRYLVMVRRDNVEHLLLIGGSNDLVVESNIVRAQAGSKQLPATITPTQQDQMASIPEPEEQAAPIASPIAAATTFGAAGLAGVTSIASSASSKVVDTASSTKDMLSDAATATVETASAATQSSVEAVSDTASSLVDTGSDAIEKVSEATAEVVESTPKVEVAEIDLESTISAQLDNVLSIDDVEIENTPEAKTQLAENEVTNSDDDMQKLLDELSTEMKQT